MLQAMSSLAVRKEDAHQLPYFIQKRVENIPQGLRDAWDAKDYDAAFLYTVGHDKEIENLCKMYGADEQRILENFCKEHNITKDKAFEKAAFCGRKDIIMLCKTLGYADFDTMMDCVAWGGHEDLVQLCKGWGATEFNNPMLSTRNINIIKLCKEWGATEFEELAEMAAERGSEEVLRLCKEWGVTDFNYPMLRAAQFNQGNAALLCKEFGATEFNEVLAHAADSGNEQAVLICKELGATDFNEAMMTAVIQGDENIARLCIEFGADQIFEAVRQASDYWDREELDYLFNVFKDIGRSCLLITCTYVGERIKVLFKFDVGADRVAEEVGAVSDSWDSMVQSCKESKPPNFFGPPKITVTYDNEFVIGLSIREEAEEVLELIRQALKFNLPQM